MKKLIAILLLGAMMLSTLASCGAMRKEALDLEVYPLGEDIVQNSAYTSQTAWNGSASDTSWYSDSQASFTLYDGADLRGLIDLVYNQGKTFENKTVTLNNDINLGNKAWSIPATGGVFKGTFNGNNKTIGGFTMTVTEGNQSLLGTVGGNANIKNLTVEGGTITLNTSATKAYVGGVFSSVKCESGKTVKIENVTSKCTIKQTSETKQVTYLGGIVGGIEGSGEAVNITGCTFSGSITTQNTQYVGGIVGGANAVTAAITLKNCTNTGAIRGRCNIAGVFGEANKTNGNLTFTNCDNSGKIELYYEYSDGCAAGIAARVIGSTDNVITFTDCDNSGQVIYGSSSSYNNQTDVNGGRWMGGIAGYVYGSNNDNQMSAVSFTNCTNTGTLKANRTSAGLVGFVQRTKALTISGCRVDAALYFTINDNAGFGNEEKISNRYVGGLLGAVEMTNASGIITISNCIVAGTMEIYEPYPLFNSRAGGLVGMVRKADLRISDCQINTKFSTKHFEEDDVVNLTIGGFEGKWKSGTSYDWYLPPVDGLGGNTLTTSNVTYYYHNEIPNVESYAKVSNTAAYFKPVGHQYRYNAFTNTYDLRYVFGVNQLQPTDLALGFEIAVKKLGDSVSTSTASAYCSKVYNTVKADGVTYKASDFDCQYLCTLTIQGVPASQIALIEDAAYVENTLLDIVPFTQTAKDTDPVKATIGSASHTLEPERHTFGLEAFTPYLPEVFEKANTVIEQYNISYKNGTGVSCVNYKQLKTNDQYALQSDCTCGGSCGWSANGATAYKLNANVPYHYYIDTASYKSKFGTEIADRYEAYYSFTFEVAEDGYYDFCFRIRLNAADGGKQTRYALVQFDDEAYHEQTEFYYNVVVRHGIMLDNDANRDSYITGYSKYLTKGKHTVTFRSPYDAADGTRKDSAFHIREIYYFKDAAEPVDANIPLPTGAVLYDGSFSNDVTYALDGTTKTVFDAYRNTLTANGFTQKDYRRTDFRYSSFDKNHSETSTEKYTYTGNYKSIFSTYYNDYYIYTNADYMLNVYFCSATGDMRVVVSDVEQYEKYDAVNDQNPAYTEVTTPLFAMLDIGGRDFTTSTGTGITGVPNGMCLVYRLSDGRFIIVDGGYWNDNDTKGEEMARLFDWLQKNADYDGDGNYANNKVTIAAWLITHHHSDHINGAYKFGMMYKDSELVEIENFLYNFPSYEYAESNYGTDLQIGNAYTKFFPKMYTMLGHYDSQIVHSGMVYHFADASIEILSTHEDFYPDPLNIYNNSSTIFKITLADKTFLVAGDLQEEGQIKAIKRCGTLLESDFLQVTHHGCNGQPEFFKYIVGTDLKGNFNTDTVIIWPLPKGENQSWYEGTSARAVAMKWLRDRFNTTSNDTTHFAVENWVFTDFQ